MHIAVYTHAHTYQSLPWFWFFVTLIILLIVCALCFMKFFDSLEQSRIVTDTPQSKLRSAAQGFVRVQGIVNPLFEEALLKSPLKQKQCCWYRYSIEQEITSYDDKGNPKKEWQTIEEGHSTDLFSLKDDTGECVVFPVGADVVTAANETWYSGGFVTTIFSSNFSFIPGNGRYRYTEHRLEPGQNTIALGFFQTRDAKDNPVLEHQNALQNDPEKLDALKKKHSFLAKADINFLDFHSKLLSNTSHEWEKFAENKSSINLLSNYLLQDRPFIVSDLALEKLVAHYRWQVLGFGFGFIVSGVIAIALTFLKITGKI